MRVAVVDGQGGGIGQHIIQKIRQRLGEGVEILALGTNAVATSVMLRAGANEGATGENAFLLNAGRVDVIVGSIAMLIPHSMLGELTPAMAGAVSISPALKLAMALNRERVEIIEGGMEPLPHQIDRLVTRLIAIMEGKKNVRS